MDDHLDWRKVLADDFTWPGAGTDDDPGEEMDLCKNSFRKMLEAGPGNYQRRPEFDIPDDTMDESDYDEEDVPDIVLEEGQTFQDAVDQIELLKQDMYRLDAECYRFEENLGPDKEQRFFIRPGHAVFSCTELSSGYSWIGVSANEKTWVVTMRDPIHKLPPNKTQLSPYTVVKGALMDIIADTPTSFRKIEGFKSGNFAVVSVASGASDQETYPLVFRFLQEKMKDCSTISYEETQQIAICALKLLLGQAFNPYKIEVCGWENDNQLNGVAFRMPAKGIRDAVNNMV